jgi:phenylpropionate dioxygenase-like ring-hydroxylating dioxygenase large terminal subunit
MNKLLLLFLTTASSLVNVTSFILPGLYYPVAIARDVARKPLPVLLQDTRLVIFRNGTNHVVTHSDVCPHQGALFSGTGSVDAGGTLICGYHGFHFCNGRFLGMPGAMTKRPRGFQLPLWETAEKHGMVFVRAPGHDGIRRHVHAAPEAEDGRFRCIRGARIVQQHHQVVTENVLDMMHISYVHKAFGNRVSPLPTEVKYEAMGDFAGKSSFCYRPRPGSLASLLDPPFPEVLVENEFFLPGTTVTRVSVAGFVKTVVTRALPINDGATKLFWEVHRNFFTDGVGLGDAVMHNLMEQTLDEDVHILRHVDARHREGPLQTKYDVTIKKYRQAVEHWMATTAGHFLTET